MKKIMLLFLGIILITGCSNNKENELCNKVDEIDVNSYTQQENYDELTKILENHYATYCEDTSSEVCKALDDYIKTTKSEMNFKDCNSLEGNWKNLCEFDNIKDEAFYLVKKIASLLNKNYSYKNIKVNKINDSLYPILKET